MSARMDISTQRKGRGSSEAEVQVHTLPSEFVGQGKGGIKVGKAQMASSDLAGQKKRIFFLV